MKKVYIVMGETGEYSDYTEWLVRAYLDEDKAKQHAKEANDWCDANRLFTKEQRMTGGWPRNSRTLPDNPFDPGMQCDYTGTTYGVAEVELIE